MPDATKTERLNQAEADLAALRAKLETLGPEDDAELVIIAERLEAVAHQIKEARSAS